VFDAFQSRSVTVSGAKMGSDGAAGFSFPLDLIKKISPVSILSLVGDKLPGPLKGGFDKALDLASLSPLLDKLKQADLHGALGNVLSMPMMEFCSKLDTSLPARLLERILLDPTLQNAISSALDGMPEQLQWPLLKLQEFSDHLKQAPAVLLEDCDAVLRNFEEYAEVYSHPTVNFKFPDDIIKGITPGPTLMMLGEKIPAPMGSSFNELLVRAQEGKTSENMQLSLDDDVEDDEEFAGVDTTREAAEDDGVEADSDADAEASKKAPNFIEMIDKLLSKLDPLQFVKLIEKLHHALPPPGQAVLEPFIVILRQACEVKAKLMGKVKGITNSGGSNTTSPAKDANNSAKDEISSSPSKGPVEPTSTMMDGRGRQGTPAVLDAKQGTPATVDATVGTLGGGPPANPTGSVGVQDVSLEGLTEEEKDEKIMKAAHEEYARMSEHYVDDEVKVDVAGAEKDGWNFTSVILGCMAVCGLVTIGVLVAMAVSPDCGCGTECPAAQKWAAACPAICECE